MDQWDAVAQLELDSVWLSCKGDSQEIRHCLTQCERPIARRSSEGRWWCAYRHAIAPVHQDALMKPRSTDMGR